MANDVVGPIITELRTANIASGRVRKFEADVDDAKPPGSYHRFVVVVDLGGPPVRHIIQRTRLMIRAYGATFQDARALYSEIQEALHLTGPRLPDSGKPIYNIRDDTGPSQHRDPDTQQPYCDGVYVVTNWIGPALP